VEAKTSPFVVVIARDQIAGQALEDHRPAIGGHHRFGRTAVARAGGLLIQAGEQVFLAPVAHKNVAGVVVVVFHQVAGLAGEDGRTAIRAEERRRRSALPRRCRAVEADQLRRTSSQVFDKEVVDARAGAFAFKCNQPASALVRD